MARQRYQVRIEGNHGHTWEYEIEAANLSIARHKAANLAREQMESGKGVRMVREVRVAPRQNPRLADPDREDIDAVVRPLAKQWDFDDFQVESGIYWFASDYHHGQSSNLYSVLSMSEYHPGRNESGPDEFALIVYETLEDAFFPNERTKKTYAENPRKNVMDVMRAFEQHKSKGHHGDSIWTNGDHVYSYHTCLLVRTQRAGTVYVLNMTRYSVTTSRQQNDILANFNEWAERNNLVQVKNLRQGATADDVLDAAGYDKTNPESRPANRRRSTDAIEIYTVADFSPDPDVMGTQVEMIWSLDEVPEGRTPFYSVFEHRAEEGLDLVDDYMSYEAALNAATRLAEQRKIPVYDYTV